MEELYEELKIKMNENYLEYEMVRLVLLPILEKINQQISVDFEMGFMLMEKLKIIIPNTQNVIEEMKLMNLKDFDEDKEFIEILLAWCEGFIMCEKFKRNNK